MIRYKPFKRSAGNPKKTPTKAVSNTANGAASQKLRFRCVIKIALVYAPQAINAACPKEICPQKPVKIHNPRTATIHIRATLIIPNI